MVVKSDGSLTSIEAAKEHPIETILSGPAASVAGVQHLTKHTDALVVDMGGTTSDTAVIEGGIVQTCEEGAVVGGWETHVQALAMRTLGLGGDSLITWEKGQIAVGPRRVAPVSWLVSQQPAAVRALDWIERHLSVHETSTRSLELVALNGWDESRRFEGREARIVDALRESPCSLEELARRTDCIAWQLLPLRRLEDAHVIQRCGLTPTDLLHTTGRIQLWDTDAARRLCDIYSRLQRSDSNKFAAQVIAYIERRLATELLKKQLEASVDVSGIEESPVAKALIAGVMGADVRGLKIRVTLDKPIVGIGAPVHLFLPEAAKMLNTDWDIPPDADVANAIGAITSSVFIHRRAVISVDETGTYHVKGLPEALLFDNLDSAEKFAVENLKELVRDMALKAGTSQTEIEIVSDDKVGTASDGCGVFLGRTVEVRLLGKPDLARLAERRASGGAG